MSHSRFAPSSMSRTVACSGWVKMSEGIEEIETEDARQGEAVHWVGESMLNSLKTSEVRVTSHDWIGQTSPNGVVITEDMYDAAYTYYIDVAKLVNETGTLQSMYAETTLAMPEIHQDCWGTPDCFVWDEKTLTLYVWDLKYGHRSVVAYENWQLLAYALGALHIFTNGDPLTDRSNIKIKLNVVQPRCFDGQGPYRRWETDSHQLRAYVNNMNDACIAVDHNPICTVGPHCRDCPGAFRCSALLNASAGSIDLSYQPTKREMTNEGLVYELGLLEIALDALKNRQSALEADAEQRLRQGTRIPGLIMTDTFGREGYKLPDDQIIAMGELMGMDFRKPATAITPNQARQLMKKNNVDPAVINDYTIKSKTGSKLTREDETRAQHIFSQEKI